jgi:hypothetical protein
VCTCKNAQTSKETNRILCERCGRRMVARCMGSFAWTQGGVAQRSDHLNPARSERYAATWVAVSADFFRV